MKDKSNMEYTKAVKLGNSYGAYLTKQFAELGINDGDSIFKCTAEIDGKKVIVIEKV